MMKISACHGSRVFDRRREAPNTVNHGYPFRAECGCGWKSIGYAAAHAAQTMLDAHRKGELE